MTAPDLPDDGALSRAGAIVLREPPEPMDVVASEHQYFRLLVSLSPWSSTRTRRRWRIALTLVSFGIAVGIALSYGGDVATALGRIRRIHVGRLVVAIILEAASVMLVAALQRRLVRRAGATLTRRRAVAVAAAGGAIALSVPGGPLIANAYSYQQYRRRGLDQVVVGWVVTTMSIISTIALTVFSIIGARGSSGLTLSSIAASVAVIILMIVTVLVVTAPERLDRFVIPLLRLSRRVVKRPAVPVDAWASFASRLTAVEIRRRDWLVLFGFSLGNWATDCGCLYLSARALNAHLTFTSVVVAYAIGQAILILPLTPGGIGIYEAGVTAALTRVGIRRGKALTSVMMYRFISFWGMLLVGWICWTVLHVIDKRADRAVPLPPPVAAGEPLSG